MSYPLGQDPLLVWNSQDEGHLDLRDIFTFKLLLRNPFLTPKSITWGVGSEDSAFRKVI